MAETLTCTLLGPPQVCLGTEPALALGTRKAQAIFYYLMVTGQPHTRETVANLLWADMPEAQAKTNLRTLLSRLRKVVGGSLHITRDALSFNREQPYWLDVEQFRRLLEMPAKAWAPAAVQDAVALYQGAFLEGFSVRQAPVFDDWLASQRQALHTLVVQGLEALIQHALEHGDNDAGLM